MLRLALHGGLFSGKTTLAEALRDQGNFQLIDYTGLLKLLAVEALNAIGVTVTIEEMLANKEKYRPFIIELGRLCGFDEGFGLDEIVEKLQDDISYVLDNVRFDAQYEKLEKAGFILVRVQTPMHIRVARAIGKGITRQEFARRIEDATEAPLREFPNEVRISVDGPIEDILHDLTTKIAALQLAQKRQARADAGQVTLESDAAAADAEELGVVAATETEPGS